MWDFHYQFSKQNKRDLKFGYRFLSDTFYVQAYNLKTKAKFQNVTHGLGEELLQMTCAKVHVCMMIPGSISPFEDGQVADKINMQK